MRLLNVVLLLAYLACVPLANWLIGHVGTVCVSHGPCLVPVGFDLMAPSGVVVVGFALNSARSCAAQVRHRLGARRGCCRRGSIVAGG